MKYFLWIIMIASFLVNSPAVDADEPQIRVLIYEGCEDVSIQSRGVHIISGWSDGSRVYLSDEEHCSLRTAGEGVQIISADGREFELPSPVLIKPASPDSELMIEECPFEAEDEEDKPRIRRYHGLYEIHVQENGLNIIVELPTEEYLCGVVPSEIGSRSPIEAMKAQAVAARTEAWAALTGKRYAGDNYDICASVMCQAFSGTTHINDAVRRAVSETRGLVMFHDNEPIGAYYSSNCGGHTENSENVWDGRGYLAYCRGVDDAEEETELDLSSEDGFKMWLDNPPNSYCNPDYTDIPEWARRKFRWTKKFTAEKMHEIVTNAKDIGRVKKIVPLARGVSGRLIEVEFIGENGSVKVGPELAIRNLFSPRLTSAAFIVETMGDGEYPDEFIVRGAGSGHGVGMCQFGAMGMALQGFKFDSILTHYYSGIEIKQVYP